MTKQCAIIEIFVIGIFDKLNNGCLYESVTNDAVIEILAMVSK